MNRYASLAVIFALWFGAFIRAEAAPSGAAPQIGVVDLDKVAVDMGWMVDMKVNLSKLQAQFRADLERVQASQNTTLAQKKKDLGLTEKDTSMEDISRKLTQPQQQELVQMLNASRQQLYQLQQSANQQFQIYEANGVKQYRDAVAPIVKKVAQANKTLLVISQGNGTILYLDDTIDLTPAVTKELKASPPVLQPMPFPRLSVSGETTQPATQPASK